MKYNNKIKIAVLFVLLLSFTACQSSLMDTNPYDSMGSGDMWKTEDLADKGVLGVYAALRYSYTGLNIWKFDDYGVSSDNREPDEVLLQGKATTGTALFSDYWQDHYEGIHRANDAIANLPKAPLTTQKLSRLVSECKFLRAFFYYKLNMMYKGVPLYLQPIDINQCTRGRETEETIWKAVLNDLNDCINNPNLPDIYKKGDANYGRITKGAAYALRGKVYLWMAADLKDGKTQDYYSKAISDFENVHKCGFDLFQGTYKELFKEANEQSPEMIFSVQCMGIPGYGNEISFRYGTRVTYGSCWDTYLVNTDFVDSYEWKDGEKFNWDDVIPGYSTMDVNARSVYFLRNNMTDAEKQKMQNDQHADLTKYISTANETRILKAYTDRDPRLNQTVITPYSTYDGAIGSNPYTYTLRWPYRGYDEAEPYDLRTDVNSRFHYLFRKFVSEGPTEIPGRDYSTIDVPIIRYADVLLNLAEVYNETGQMSKAIDCVNKVRARAGVALLNSNQYTQVQGQEDLRERIRNERRWEFAGEGVDFFDEMRWHSWKESRFYNGSAAKQIWGTVQYTYSWDGDYIYTWPIPKTECQMNPNLIQNPGWKN